MTTIATAPAVASPTARAATTHRPIPLSRIVTTELRKMFDTRSGFWLMASIGILALLATTACSSRPTRRRSARSPSPPAYP